MSDKPKKTTPTKVGAEHVCLVKEVYDRLKDVYTVGPDRVLADLLGKHPTFPLKRQAVGNIIKHLKGGKNVEDILADYGKGKGRKATKATADLAEKVDADIRTDCRTLINSQRALAKRYGASKGTIGKVIRGY